MKKISLSVMSLIAGVMMVSCSSDDNNDNNSNRIEGTYTLREFNTPQETDLNDDGTSNTNQMNETTCYNNSKIDLRADQTFTYDVKQILINNEGASSCTEYSVTGIWEASGSGNNAVLTLDYDNPNGDSETLVLNKEGNELSTSSILTQYPNGNQNDGYFYSTGTVEWVFRR